MKKGISLLLVAMLLLALAACAGPNVDDAPKLVLNGKKLNVYTSHYVLSEECAYIPVGAFLKSIGAEYADSPLYEVENSPNPNSVQCYSFLGKRYVLDRDSRLFMLEENYLAFVEEVDSEWNKLAPGIIKDSGLHADDEALIRFLDEERMKLMQTRAKGRGLLPNEEPPCFDGNRVDHISLMKALNDSGVDITMEYNYVTRTINVFLPEQAR